MKKIVSTVLSAAMLVGCAFGAMGCNKEEIVQDGKTVNVRVFLAGYGADFIYSLKDKFEAAYAEQGYKLNILTPSNDNGSTVVFNELAGGNSGVDLYFTEAVNVETVVNGDYGQIVEELTEIVYDQKAIKFDGTEEEKTVREKIPAASGKADTQNTYYNGKEYGFNWVAGAGGLAVNIDKLSEYGLEMPKTTDELIVAFDIIYNGTTLEDGTILEGSKVSGVYPHTFVSGSSMYPEILYQTWAAQYMGLEEYTDFQSMLDEEDNPRLEDGYKVYENVAIKEMLKVAYQVFDATYSTPGSTTQDADTANSKVAKNGTGAVFMANGSWMLNEVKLNYPEAETSLRFVNVPVISALGTKVFGAGTTANITDEDKCDEVLSKVVGWTDEKKTANEIVSLLAAESVTVLESEVQEIVDARNMYYSRGDRIQSYIAKDSPVKDIAALALRMYASDDFAAEFSKTANATTPFDSRINIGSQYAFVNDVAKIINDPSAVAFNGVAKSSDGLRKQIGISGAMVFGKDYLALSIINERVSKFNNDGVLVGSDSVYEVAAEKLYQSNITDTKAKWNEWLKNAGLKD